MTRANGVDIASYHCNPDMDILLSKVDFFIHRYSIGIYKDKEVAKNWEAIKDFPVRGLYHVPFKYEIASKDKQKAHIRAALALNPTLPLILDVEVLDKVYISHVFELGMYIFTKSGKYPIIYTRAEFWNKNMWRFANASHQDFFSKCKLWVAQYKTDAPDPTAPWGDNWTFWQHGIAIHEDAAEYGVIPWQAKSIDENVYKGTIDELHAEFLSGEVPPDPPVPPAPQDEYVRVVGCDFLSFRNRPVTYPGDRPGINPRTRDRIKVLKREDGWLYVELSGGDKGWIWGMYTVEA